MPDKIARREAAARERIGAVYGTPGDEYAVTLFVALHLQEIDAAYWVKHTGTGSPDPHQVLDLLEPGPQWAEEEHEEEDDDGNEEFEILDFTLPGGVTNYVICVTFDKADNIANVSMES